MNTSSQEKNQSSLFKSPKKNDSLGRDTIFAGDLTNNFISPNPHQKKRDLDKIQKVSGSTLHVLESNPQNETYKQKPLIQIVRNTYETKNGTKKKIRCMSPVLNFSTESAPFHEETAEVKGHRKVYKEKVGLEANSIKKETNIHSEKSKRVEKIMDSVGMKESLTSKESGIGEIQNGAQYKALVKATSENVVNNRNTPYKFKHSLDNKQAFYVN